MEFSVIISVLGGLVALTNILVEVLKKVTYNKIPTSLLALIIGETLTVVSGFAYFQFENLLLTWYVVVAFVIAGFMVAYAAMFGFDKLKEVMNWSDKR